MADSVYITPEASGFRTFVTVGDEKVLVQFVDGNYRTDKQDVADAIDAGIAAGHLSRWVRKVDRSAGERLVQEHIKQRLESGAQSGVTTSQSTAQLNALSARDQELHQEPDKGVSAAKLADESDLMLTEESSQAPQPTEAPKASGIKLGKG